MTVVLGHPLEMQEWIARRAALGQDRHDEVWEGRYHVVPGPSDEHAEVDASLGDLLSPRARAAGLRRRTAFNLGEPGDYRVPDGGFRRGRGGGVFVPTAEVVVEVLSPDDETFEKFAFYAARGVQEIVVADPAQRSVRIWRLRPAAAGVAPSYEEVDRSHVLDVGADELTAGIDWP